jgi:hypothetical protein
MIYETCGTPSGYRRHLRNNTTPCDACRRAIAAYMRAWRHENGHNKARLIPDTIIKQHGIQVKA